MNLTNTICRALAICMCASFSLPVAATEHESGAWLIASTTDTFQGDGGESRWRYWFDAQARYFDVGGGITQYVVRPGIGYDLNSRASVWAGYARIRTNGRSGASVYEDRYWQQLSWSAGRWNEGTVSLRARLEQRDVSVGDDLGLALRLMAKYVRPIGSGRTNLVLSLEPFIDLRDTDWGGDSGVAQNRTSLGVGWRMSKNVAAEVGYMNQYIWADSGDNRINHLAVASFRFSF